MRIIIEPTKERVRRTGACRPAHIQPRPAPEVILYGADRSRGHISGYKIRQRRPPKPSQTPIIGDDDAVVLSVDDDLLVPGAGLVAGVDSGPGALSVPDVESVLGATGVKRGRVGKYTRAARGRLGDAVLSVGHKLVPERRGKRNGRPVFFRPGSLVTLTYRAGHVPHIDPCYAHLFAFWKQLKRVPGWEKAWGVQVREYQENGSLHFHLLVHWGLNCWTRPFSEVQAWLSKTWAGIVAKDMGPDEYHLRAGTNIKPIISDKMLDVYISKGGVQKLQPGAIMASELSKHVQKSGEVLLAALEDELDPDERLRRLDALLDEAVGHHWWGYLDAPRFKAEARVTRVESTPEVAYALKNANDESWVAFFEGKGIKREKWEIPQRASGVVSDRIIAQAGVRGALMSSCWVDELTGEVHEVPTVPAMLVQAVGGGVVEVAGGVSALGSAPRVVPCLWRPLGSPPLSRGGLSLVRPPGASPPPLGPSGFPLCRGCGEEESSVRDGLCIYCDKSLPGTPGRAAPSVRRSRQGARSAEPLLLFPGLPP